MVRVPRNIINLATNVKIPGYKNLDLTLNTKWSDDGKRLWKRKQNISR